MAEFTLEAQKRTLTGKKVGRLRREGLVPGTIYGPKTDPINFQVPHRILQVALMRAGGTNVIDVKMEDGDTYPVLAREVQRDIIRGHILHVDFFALDLTQKIQADIPLHLVGESPAVETRTGILITGPNSLTIEVLASRLMNQIEVDISGLKDIGDTITVADLPLDEDITVINDPEEMIAKIVQPSAARALEAEEAAEEEAEIEESAEPELIGRDDEDEDFEE